MADISDINSAQSIKVIGADSTGVEQTPVASTASGGLHVNLRNASGAAIGVSSQPLTSNNAFSTVANTRPSVTNSSSIILAANVDRRYVLIINQGTQAAYLKLGAAAVVTQGIPLQPGASFTLDANNLYTGAIHAIKPGAGSVTLEIMEGTA